MSRMQSLTPAAVDVTVAATAVDVTVAATAAGAVTVGVLSSQSPEVLRRAGCRLLIRDYDDPALWDMLEAAAPGPPSH